MIQITLTTAMLLYGTILLFMAVLIWAYTEITSQHSQKRLESQSLWRCVFCGYTYLDRSAETLSQCPRCASFNALDDKHARFVRTQKPAERETDREYLPADGVEPRRNPSRRKRPGQRRRGPRRR